MADALHDWLGSLVESEFRGALSWKNSKDARARQVVIKQEQADLEDEDEDESKYRDDFSSLHISITRSKSLNSYVQFRPVSSQALHSALLRF